MSEAYAVNASTLCYTQWALYGSRTRDATFKTRGIGDLGTQDQETQDTGTWDPWTRIGIYCTCTYIVHVSLIAWLDGMDYEILCIVDGTFVLASFVRFHFVRHQKDPFTVGKVYQMASIELIEYARVLWPLRLRGGCMNEDPMQGRTGYEWVTVHGRAGYCYGKTI